jgi:NAD(P)-dependent dehydrogenase (short-subunit alcohol dehydrogenase family)
MIAINVQGLLYTTRAALPHLLQAVEDGPRRVADIVNIRSIAGRVAWDGYGACSRHEIVGDHADGGEVHEDAPRFRERCANVARHGSSPSPGRPRA